MRISGRAAEEFSFALIVIAIVVGIVVYHLIDSHSVAQQIQACYQLPKVIQHTCIQKVP